MISFYYFMLGASIASFYFLVAFRLPLGQPIGFSRSKCDSCQQTLHARELIPIFSFFYNHGRCRYCQTKLSLAYPLFELFGGSITLYLFYSYAGKLLLINGFLYSILFLIAAIDYHHLFIPDSLQISLFLLLFADPHNQQSTLGAVAFLFLSLFSSYFVKHGLGGGDVKLLVILGFYFGYLTTTKLLLLAASLALSYFLVKKQEKLIPFAPYLAFAFFIIKEFFVS